MNEYERGLCPLILSQQVFSIKTKNHVPSKVEKILYPPKNVPATEPKLVSKNTRKMRNSLLFHQPLNVPISLLTFSNSLTRGGQSMI